MRAQVALAFVLGSLAGGLLLWAIVRPQPQPPAERNGRPSPPRSAPAAADAERPEPARRVRLSPAVVEGLRAAAEEGFKDASGNTAGYYAIATLYALADLEDDFVRAVRAGIAAGADFEGTFEILAGFPRARVPAVLQRLLRELPDVDWDYAAAASILLAHDLQDEMRAVLALGVQRSEAPPRDLAVAYAAADPDGAASALLRRANEWGVGDLNAVAAALLDAERPQLALRFVDIAIRRFPENDDALGRLASIDPAAARMHAERRVAKDEADVAAWAVLGRLRKEAGDLDGAFDALLERARREPETEALWELFHADPARALPVLDRIAMGTTDDEVMGVAAKAHLRRGEREKAVDVYLRALERDPSDPEWIRALVELAPQRAVEVLHDRVERSPLASDEILGGYAKALLAVGRKDQAYTQFARAHDRDPDDSEWLDGLARADPRRAEPLLRKLLAKSPRNKDYAGALGVAVASLGRRDEALALLSGAADGSGNRSWYVPMARVAPAEAERRLRAHIEKEPEDDELWGTLGKVYEESGRRADALDAYRRALELDPSDSEWSVLLEAVR